MATLLFSFGGLFQGEILPQPHLTHPPKKNRQLTPLSTVSVLLINSLAVLSEDRFLARSKLFSLSLSFSPSPTPN